MGNREKILNLLKQEGPLCDSCITKKAIITNHATVNQITRNLMNMGVIIRSSTVCPGCKKVNKTNRLTNRSLTISNNMKSNNDNNDITKNIVDIKEQWYWEGNVQKVIVSYLQKSGYRILKTANTAIKESGIDITALTPDMRRLLITVKGYPDENNKSKNTQARHWFAEAIFDLVLYRQEYPEVMLAIGLPDDFATYKNLSEKVSWFKESLPFMYYWVGKDQSVRED